MTEDELLLLWGKTARDPVTREPLPDRYHPLLFHLLDVAHVTLALWDEVLPESTRRHIVDALGCEVEAARLCVAFLAGAHDVGKANPAFQFQPTGLGWLAEQLQELGLVLPLKDRNEPHNFVSSKVLRPFLGDQSGFWHSDDQSGHVLAHIAGAHHGTFPDSLQLSDYTESVLGNARWQQARELLLEALRDALCPSGFAFPPAFWDEAEIGVGAIPIVAGLISVADWIGSSHHFKHEARRGEKLSLHNYLPLSRQRARAALEEFGWARGPTPASPRPDFAEFWAFEPNALQRAIIAQTADVETPFLMIAEAPMGLGKTEGALWASDAALSSRGNAGFYVALPTQATSNAMHRRVQAFLEQRFPDERAIHLQLVHSNAILSNQVLVSADGLNPMDDAVEPGQPPAVVAASWFLGAKRPLLAPFGVGTIDQSLMGALQTRHWFVRLFGLAGKVVVFDEVHAYDAYMSGLLSTLLQWLRALGCSVILLSATLPIARRRELLAAWNAALPNEEAPYPRLTWCGPHDTQATSIEVSREDLPRKTVHVSRLPLDSLAATLRRALADGGSAALICNTVAQAQGLFSSLKGELGDFVSPDNWILFHARMPFGWRRKIERKIGRKFGKNKSNRPHCAIVVATQVLEQSLDLDFDWMGSEMAPSDLLLQRLGRLHRHDEDERDEADKSTVRPSGVRKPRFVILTSAETEGSPPQFGHSELIYEREILLRSWLLWRGKNTLELPAEIGDLVEATYAQAPPGAPDEEWRLALEQAASKAEKRRQKARDTAGNVVVAPRNANGNLRDPEEIVEAPSLDLRDDDDPARHTQVRAATRDGDPSISVVCLLRHQGRLYLPRRDARPDLQAAIDLQAEPTHKQIRALMDASLALSQPAIYQVLVEQKAPPGWRKSPLLRHSRALIFQEGICEVAGCRLILDGELGLRIEKAAPDESKSAE